MGLSEVATATRGAETTRRDMSTACLFLSWDQPKPGYEAAFGKITRDLLGQLDQFQREAWFERYEVIGLTPHSGTVNSFCLLIGERAKLDELRRSDAFERLSMHLARSFTGYGVVPGVTLEGLRKVIQRNPELFGET
jgi:hypothetical protein